MQLRALLWPSRRCAVQEFALGPVAIVSIQPEAPCWEPWLACHHQHSPVNMMNMLLQLRRHTGHPDAGGAAQESGQAHRQWRYRPGSCTGYRLGKIVGG